MPNVVKKGGRQDSDALVVGYAPRTELCNAINNAPRDMHHADRMGKAAVVGAREHELAKPELLDPPQTLKLSRVDQLEQEAITLFERDDVVNRVADQFWPRVAHFSHPRVGRASLAKAQWLLRERVALASTTQPLGLDCRIMYIGTQPQFFIAAPHRIVRRQTGCSICFDTWMCTGLRPGSSPYHRTLASPIERGFNCPVI
ncbi:hypothetical protein LCGC14_2006740 [marine sediment metagenome]|uniref:Uncharacterized protein n=1 Tax=marine sediment metagenome TaxID=412755 RepID=A0A0F9F1L4_9ZZZZ